MTRGVDRRNDDHFAAQFLEGHGLAVLILQIERRWSLRRADGIAGEAAIDGHDLLASTMQRCHRHDDGDAGNQCQRDHDDHQDELFALHLDLHC